MNPRVLLSSDPGIDIMSKFHHKKITWTIIPFIKVRSNFDQNGLIKLIQKELPEVIAVSSKNALTALAQIKQKLPSSTIIYCISKKIAYQVSGMGFSRIQISPEGNSESLFESINNKSPNVTSIYLCGNLARKIDTTAYSNLKMIRFEAYQTEILNPVIESDLYEAIVFTSYSTIDGYYNSNSLSNDKTVFTIGPNTSKYLKKYYEGKVIIASEPDWEHLLNDICRHYATN
jgi:uroporphyrinogen-III synthase